MKIHLIQKNIVLHIYVYCFGSYFDLTSISLSKSMIPNKLLFFLNFWKAYRKYTYEFSISLDQNERDQIKWSQKQYLIMPFMSGKM